MVRRRRPLAALLAGLSLLLALTSLRPARTDRVSRGRTVSVLVAAHDLAAGGVLRDGDVRTAPYPASLVPDGAMRPDDVVSGRQLVFPVRAGEPLTDVRFVADGLLSRLTGPGSVAAPVRIADAGELALVRPGSHVDVLAAPSSEGSGQTSRGAAADGSAVTIASGAVVLSVPQTASSAVTDGGLVVLAVPAATARTLAGAAATDRLSLVLRP